MKNTPTSFEDVLIEKAKSLNKTIVLPEAGLSQTVTKAGVMVAEQGIAKVVLLCSSDSFAKDNNITESDNLKVVNVLNSDLAPVLASCLYEKRKEKGMTIEIANEQIKDVVYFGTLMVELGLADGMTCGKVHTSADSLRPALQIIKGKEKGSLISTYMIMISENTSVGDNGVILLSDCGLNMDPSSDGLKQICFSTVESARAVCDFANPVVAMLSYSTKGSADGEGALKVREATKLIKDLNPDFVVDGEMQFDAAVVDKVCAQKAPESKVKGDANILVFPDLQSGNIGYKIMQRFAGFKCIGPLTQGLKKPVNDISRGADEMEIVRSVAITVLQCN